ncbi:MAG: DUF2853 family protein [Verrucomicrobiales bacterium]|nr:DUF2853 family protein [Verrucomicrobiales bacterium]
MSKIDELVEKYAKDVEEVGVPLDKTLLRAVAKGCGPSLYRKDACLVAASDPKEVERVKQNFCIKKLGVKDTPKLDEGISEVLKSYKKRQKQRAVVYYLLVKKFKKGSVYK